MTGSDLTIALPLAGRPEFTQRFVDHASALPFRFLLDPGEGRLPVQAWLAKINAVTALVETPYVMIADNDDLPTADLSACVHFLDGNPSYVCASGKIEGFHMWPDPVRGPHSAVTGLYTPYDAPADYFHDDINDRVLAGFANSWSYYGVYRTEALRQIRKEVIELGLTDLQVHEKFCAMRTLTLGKAICFPNITTLYRQHGTSQGAANYKRDEARRMADMEKVLGVMAAAGVDYHDLRFCWANWYYHRDRYLAGKWRKRAKRAFPALAWLVQNRHRYLPRKALNVQG